MLGGCEEARPHPKGVQVAGAFVLGVLDLKARKSPLGLVVAFSRLAKKPVLRDSELGQLVLSGSALPGMNAQRMTVQRDVYLRQGFHSTDLVDLAGSRIGGRLDCSSARFEPTDGVALRLEGMNTGHDVFLREGLVVAGDIRCTRCHISGNLLFRNADMQGAITADGMIVEGTLYWRDMTEEVPKFNLETARLGKLDDDRQSWDLVSEPLLSGLIYDDLGPSISTRDRLKLLSRNKTIPDKDNAGKKNFQFQPAALQPFGKPAGPPRAEALGRAGFV